MSEFYYLFNLQHAHLRQPKHSELKQKKLNLHGLSSSLRGTSTSAKLLNALVQSSVKPEPTCTEEQQ